MALDATGQLKVTITYATEDLGTTETVTRTFGLPGSSMQQGTTSTAEGGEPTAEASGWSFLRELDIPWRDLLPDDFLTDEATLAQWSNWTVADVKIEVECGARIQHVCCYTAPAAIGFESADTDVAAHVAATGTQALGLYHRQYPVEKADTRSPDDDPRLGTEWLCLVNAALHQQGPQLLSWHAWDEGSAAYSDTETDVTTTSTSFVDLVTGVAFAHSVVNASWTIASAGYARRLTWSEPKLGIPNRAAVPVRVSVYAKVTGGTSTVRVQSSNESWVDVSITSTSIGWHTAVGFLECGQGADDTDAVVHVGIKASSAETLTVRALSVHYDEKGPTV